jgi:hypothetical protein
MWPHGRSQGPGGGCGPTPRRARLPAGMPPRRCRRKRRRNRPRSRTSGPPDGPPPGGTAAGSPPRTPGAHAALLRTWPDATPHRANVHTRAVQQASARPSGEPGSLARPQATTASTAVTSSTAAKALAQQPTAPGGQFLFQARSQARLCHGQVPASGGGLAPDGPGYRARSAGQERCAGAATGSRGAARSAYRRLAGPVWRALRRRPLPAHRPPRLPRTCQANARNHRNAAWACRAAISSAEVRRIGRRGLMARIPRASIGCPNRRPRSGRQRRSARRRG